jgi:hypothetical protein
MVAEFDVLSQRVIDLTQQIDSICAKIRSVLVYHTVKEYPPHLNVLILSLPKLLQNEE